MLTSRRDYILRIIDEVGRLLASVVFKRRVGEPEQALQTVIQACERLFSLEADKLFQFTPAQHFIMLTEGETPEIARDKLLLFSALNAEAGQVYAGLGNTAMARATIVNALRFTLRARTEFPTDHLPSYAPSIAMLRANLTEDSGDEETAALLRAAGFGPGK